MSRAMYPIVTLLKGDNQRFPVAFAEIIQAYGTQRENEFTYTARLAATDDKTRDQIRAALRSESPDDAERLIALLDDSDWSVSVLVDNY